MRLIGLRCKHGDVFSLQVLIGRGLDLHFSITHFIFVLSFLSSLCSVLKALLLSLVGVNGCEVPPVPIPNTEVKLIRVEDTWLATTRENRSMPAFKQQSGHFLDCCFSIRELGPLAQLVRASGS